jgi:hypothetical protein
MSKCRRVGLVAVVLAASCSIGASAAPSRAQAAVPNRLVLLDSSASPTLPAHSISLGALGSSAELHVEVTLKLPHRGAVSAYLQALSNKTSSASSSGPPRPKSQPSTPCYARTASIPGLSARTTS